MDKVVRFYEKGFGHTTFFTEKGVYLSLDRSQMQDIKDKNQGNRKSDLQLTTPQTISLFPIGANKTPEIVAEDLQEGKINYLVGSREKWWTGIPTYRAVVYKDIYKNIDMKFYGNNHQLEYDVIVKPGANLSHVKFAYEGIKDIHITDDGNLCIDLE